MPHMTFCTASIDFLASCILLTALSQLFSRYSITAKSFTAFSFTFADKLSLQTFSSCPYCTRAFAIRPLIICLIQHLVGRLVDIFSSCGTYPVPELPFQYIRIFDPCSSISPDNHFRYRPRSSCRCIPASRSNRCLFASPPNRKDLQVEADSSVPSPYLLFTISLNMYRYKPSDSPIIFESSLSVFLQSIM